MSHFQIDAQSIARFQRDGYLMVPRLYDAQETDLLRKVARGDREKAAQARGVKDSQDSTARIWLTSDSGRDDIYNAVCHGRRMDDSMESLPGIEVQTACRDSTH